MPRKKKDPMFVGVDPSYNGFAIMVLDKEGEIVDKKLISTDSSLSIEERILELEKEFSFLANMVRLEKIYIEGPSFSSNGAYVLQMGALHYYLRIFLYKNKIDFNVVTPNSLKKFVCGEGKGNAKKEMMLMKTFKRWGIEFDSNDLCDAYGLSRMALEEYNNEKTGLISN